MKNKLMAYAAAAAIALGTVLGGGMPVLASGNTPGIQEQGVPADSSGPEGQEQQGQPDGGGAESQPAAAGEEAAAVAAEASAAAEIEAVSEEQPQEQSGGEVTLEAGWYPLAAFGWSSLAQAQQDPSFSWSNYNADPEAYFGVPTAAGSWQQIDISAGSGTVEQAPAQSPEPDRDNGLRDWERRPPRPPYEDDDDDDDDDDDTCCAIPAPTVNVGNGTTFSAADVSLLPAEFANGAFYSVTADGTVFFNNIDLSGQYFLTWDDSGSAIAVLALTDENLEIVSIDEAALVNIGTKTYLSFEAEDAVYAAVSADSQAVYKTICGFDGVVVNGSVVMEF